MKNVVCVRVDGKFPINWGLHKMTLEELAHTIGAPIHIRIHARIKCPRTGNEIDQWWSCGFYALLIGSEYSSSPSISKTRMGAREDYVRRLRGRRIQFQGAKKSFNVPEDLVAEE
jgi:hypothetical protein